jgi:serine/threonine-protein kinase
MSEAPINPDQLTDADLPVDFGRYTLTKVLGEGGMARVFLGNLSGPQGFSKPCAIKVLHSSVARRGEKFLMTLANEARLGGLLNHPNVVNTYDFGNVGGQPFIAMEFIDGLGIDQLLAQIRRPPPEITLELGIQMCAGLEYAHNIHVDGEAGNLVHRDLKPSNVILSRNGVVKVMDFGIAKASNMTGDLTGIGMTKGTPPFMSPEQMAAEDLDRRSDIFAMGSLLFEIATGKRLFNQSSISAVISSVMNVDRTLRQGGRLDALEGIFPELRPILERCLAPAREDRYSNARAMAADLKRLQRSMPMGESLEDYVQAVLRGEVPPTSLEEDLPNLESSLTADVATPVQPLGPIGTESVLIHFEESGESDAGEAIAQRQRRAETGRSGEPLEPTPEIVMEDASEPTAPALGEDVETTEQAAPALSGGTLVIGRTDPRVTTAREPKRGTGSTRRRRKVRPPSLSARRVAKWGILLGLILVLAAAVLFMVGRLTESADPQAGEEVAPDIPLTRSPAPDDVDERRSSRRSADADSSGTKGRRQVRSKEGRRAPADQGATKADSAGGDTPLGLKAGEHEQATTTDDKAAQSTPSRSASAPGRDSAAPSSPDRTASAAGDSSPQGLKTISASGAATTTSSVGRQDRLLKRESAPKEFFGGKKTKAMFRVSMLNHQSEDMFTLRLRMQCRSDGSKWRSYSLTQVARATWERPVSLDDKDRGICKYYFTAQPQKTTQEVSGPISLRSKKNPYTLTVR